MNYKTSNIRKISVFVTSTIILTSCILSQSVSEIKEINKSNVEVSKNIDLIKYIDSCHLVKLETKQNCLIGTIKDIQFAANKIFVLNSILGENEVLVFDRSGFFLNKIGSKGQGPHEYLSLNSFCINKFKNYVIIFDTYKREVHKYDYTGKYLESLPLKAECGLVIKSRFISKDRMLCVNGINSRTSTIVFESDENFDNLNIVLSSNLTHNGLYVFADNPVTTDGKYFLEPLSNIVYQYDDKLATPTFKINLHVKDYNPEKEMIYGGDYGKLFLSSLQKGFFPLSGIIENKKYLFFVQNGYFTLWDKKSNKGVSSICTLSSATNNILPLTGCDITYGVENEFVSILTNSHYTEAQKYYKTNKIQANREITKLLNEHNSEDNPTIAFYYFK
jgi:hypothetical protein